MEHETTNAVGITLSPEDKRRFLQVANDFWMMMEDGRRPDWFTQRLLDLMLHADSNNMSKLASVYPIEAEVVRCWRTYGRTWLGTLIGKEVKP